jgi:tetratricopeptide (TPR) repeat protein
MMRRLLPAVLAALASPVSGQPAFEPPPFPPGCVSPSAPCPLLDFTRGILAPALGGVTLSPVPGQPALFSVTTSDPALPAFRLMWIEEQPITPERAAADFARGLAQPGRICSSSPHGPPTRTGQSFALRCTGGTAAPVQVFLHAAQGRQRTAVLVLLAPLADGPALLARGERMAAALAGPAAPPVAAAPPARDYAQLRADCADDSDSARQIAGCDAVLARPDEQASHGIAFSNRGHARDRAGDVAGALADYERAVAVDPSYAVAHYNRAGALARLGRAEEAIQAYGRGLAIRDDPWPRVERGKLLAARGEHAQALADFEAALAASPQDPEAIAGRDRARAAFAQAAPRPVARNPLEAAVLGAGQPYVGTALLRAPLGALPGGDALLAYTRDLLAPMLGAGASLTPFGASGTALRAEAAGLPPLTMRWYEGASAGFARAMMNAFERDLNGGCVNRMLAQRGGDGARVIAYAAACPTVDPPYQLWWLEAFDSERSRILLVATPSQDGAALLAGGERVLAALGMTTPTPAAPPAPATGTAGAAASRPAIPAGPDLAALAEAFLAEYQLGSIPTADERRQITRPSQNTVRFVRPPRDGNTGFHSEVEARSCTELITREGLPGARQFNTESTYDLTAWGRLVVREGANIRLLPGSYGRRTDHRANSVTFPLTQSERVVQASSSFHADYDRLLGVIERFCTSRAAQAPAGPAQAPQVAPPAAAPSGQAAAPALAGEDRPVPPPATLAEAALVAIGLYGVLDADEHARLQRPSPDRARIEQPEMILTGRPGSVEAEARGCSDVVVTEWGHDGGGRQLHVRHIVDFERLRGLIRRDGEDFVMSEGVSGFRAIPRPEGEARVPVTEVARRIRPADTEHARAQAIWRAIELFCPGTAGPPAQPAATSRPPPAQAPAGAGTMQVKTVTGLTRDRPFSLSYPDELEEFTSADDAVALRHPRLPFQAFLTIAPATGATSAAEAQARFHAGESTTSQRRTHPDFALNGGRGLVQLPAGPAFVWQGALTGPDRTRLRFVRAELFDGGRKYELTVYVGESLYDDARPLIGFLLANLSPSSARRPCCADPVALP